VNAEPSSAPIAGARGAARNWLIFAVITGLLFATVIAFVETERLKLVPSPILDTIVSKTFAPNCACDTDRAYITFRLRRAGLMTVEVVLMDGRPIRRLAARRFSAGFASFVWYGRGGDGLDAPQATYKVRIHLWSEHRTIVLPNLIVLDRTVPTVAFTVVRRRIIPGQRLRVRYHLSEAGNPLLYVDGRLAVKGRWPYLQSSVDWFGKVNGVAVRAGEHRLTMRTRDLAGNLSQPTAVPLDVAVGQKHAARRRR
jgi:hypothetical protein